MRRPGCLRQRNKHFDLLNTQNRLEYMAALPSYTSLRLALTSKHQLPWELVCTISKVQKAASASVPGATAHDQSSSEQRRRKPAAMFGS